MTTVPRIHAEFIKAWAEGYDIEAFNPERDCWIICPEPGWFADIEYRVRPGEMEREPRWCSYDVRIDQDLFDEDELELTNHCSKPEHYNIRLLFKDGELYASEVIAQDDEDELPW
jgi:hypothetical protein